MKGRFSVRPLELESAQNSGYDKRAFKHSERVSDTRSRPSSKWKVRELRQAGDKGWGPSFRPKSFGFVVVSRRTMDGPLRNPEFRTGLHFHATQFTRFDDGSTDPVRRRIEPHRFPHHLVEE